MSGRVLSGPLFTAGAIFLFVPISARVDGVHNVHARRRGHGHAHALSPCHSDLRDDEHHYLS